MKIKSGFVLNRVADQFVVVPLGEVSINYNGIIQLNEEAAFAFELLREDITEEELVTALLAKYNVDEAEIRTDVAHFLKKLKEADALV